MRPIQLFGIMLRVELFAVLPVSPTCSMYLRQLWRFPAIRAGTRYIQNQYFQTPQSATAPIMPIQTIAANATSLQILRLTLGLRIDEFRPKKMRKKRSGV